MMVGEAIPRSKGCYLALIGRLLVDELQHVGIEVIVFIVAVDAGIVGLPVSSPLYPG